MAMSTVMEEDLEHEEEVLHAPHDVRTWWKYLQDRRDATRHLRHVLFERGLHALPGSYKVRRKSNERRVKERRGISEEMGTKLTTWMRRWNTGTRTTTATAVGTMDRDLRLRVM